MSGKLDKDEPTTGFLTLEETEIPALQRHALDIVSSMRSAACRKFLTSLSSFSTSLEVQIVIAEKPLKLADNLREEELAFLKGTLDKLRKSLYLKLDEAFTDFKRTLESRIIKAFKSAARRAATSATDIVEGWGKRKDEGGIPMQHTARPAQGMVSSMGLWDRETSIPNFSNLLNKRSLPHGSRSSLELFPRQSMPWGRTCPISWRTSKARCMSAHS